MSRLDTSVRLIGHGHHRMSVRRMSRLMAVLISGTLLALGVAHPSAGTAGVLDRFRGKKQSAGTAAVTIPTVARSSKVANTSHYESAGDGDTGSACASGDCEDAYKISFWRRMANRMSGFKRHHRRKWYFERHFSNKRMLYPVCPPFGTANHGYFPTCWRQFPETCYACPPRQLPLEPSAVDAAVEPPPSPQPVPPASPQQPVPAPLPSR